MFSEILELKGKTISALQVYSDAVMIAFEDGKTVAAVFVQAEDGNLRLEVRSRGPDGAGPAVRVYPGTLPYAGALPDYARRSGD